MTKKIRILRLIARLNVGGPARHVVWLTSRQKGRHDVLLASGRVEGGEAEMTAFIREEGAEVAYVEGLGRSIGPRDLAVFWRVLKLVREFQPDIIDTHTAKAGLHGRAAAWLVNLFRPRRRRIRTVHTFHGHVLHGYFSAAVSRFFLFLERLLGRHASDRIVVISQQQLEELSGRYRVAPRERFRLVRLGMDLDAIRKRPGDAATGDVVRVGLVGRLTAIKNPDLFLEAGRLVRAEEPAVRLVFIGDGELRPGLEEKARALGVSAEFLGNRDDINAIMADLDVLAISSDNEGTPMSVLEAFAARVPVAGTKAGGVVDLLADGRGLLSEKGDAAGLAANILRLLREPALRQEAIVKAAEYVWREYWLDRMLGEMSALYEEILEDARP